MTFVIIIRAIAVGIMDKNFYLVKGDDDYGSRKCMQVR